MTVVDPRLAQIPRELQDTFDKRVYFEELERFLHDLWIRTGGGNDDIADESIKELYPWIPSKPEDSTDILGLFAATSSRQSNASAEFFSVSSDHTTDGNEIIEATAELSVTLNASPELQETVSVKRNGNGVVTIVGTIDGANNFKLLYNYESVDLLYSGTEWLII